MGAAELSGHGASESARHLRVGGTDRQPHTMEMVNMDEMPSKAFAAYPRAGDPGSDPEAGNRLLALYQAYNELPLALGFNVFVVAVSCVAGIFGQDSTPITAGCLVLISVSMGLVGYGYTRKIGYGLKWPSNGPVVAAVLVGLSAFTFGLISYGVLRSLTWTGIRRFGVRQSWNGFRHEDVLARVNELNSPHIRASFATDREGALHPTDDDRPA